MRLQSTYTMMHKNTPQGIIRLHVCNIEYVKRFIGMMQI